MPEFNVGDIVTITAKVTAVSEGILTLDPAFDGGPNPDPSRDCAFDLASDLCQADPASDNG